MPRRLPRPIFSTRFPLGERAFFHYNKDMAISWTLKKQLKIFSGFAVLVLLIVLGGIYYFEPSPSCFDKIQNQNEEGIDCGGVCKQCLEYPLKQSVLWLILLFAIVILILVVLFFIFRRKKKKRTHR